MPLLAAPVLFLVIVIVSARVIIVFEIVVVAAPVRMFNLHLRLNFFLNTFSQIF